jgi:hypothetical protein
LCGISRNSVDKGIGLLTKKKAGKSILEDLGVIQSLVRGSLDCRPRAVRLGCPFCMQILP